jgi:uncharacterized membrane protein
LKSKSIRRYLFAGLILWIPIIATLYVLRFMIDILDQTINLLPENYQPQHFLGWDIPGLGVIFSLAILFFTGVIVTNFLGQKLVYWGEALLAKIPLVRSIYNAVKQVIETLFSSNSQAFRKVLLIEYPRKGLWSIAFQTGVANEEVHRHAGEDMITVFVPTTPNPTSGFLIMVPSKDIIELTMSVDEALKLVISLGVMQPGDVKNQINEKVLP